MSGLLPPIQMNQKLVSVSQIVQTPGRMLCQLSGMGCYEVCSLIEAALASDSVAGATSGSLRPFEELA
jgi:hypothetical protein